MEAEGGDTRLWNSDAFGGNLTCSSF
jgi:hypothetical protein